ncbi:MAG: winged helix-turn-helix transcriptional regulator [Thermoplasmatota archaeon]
MNPLARPRHLLATFLVFVLVGGGGTAILGAASAADEQGVVVTGFHVPLPHQGDRGIYTLQGYDTSDFAQLGLDVVVEAMHFRFLEDRAHLHPVDGFVLSNRAQYHTAPDQVNGIRAPVARAGEHVPFASEWVLDGQDAGSEVRNLRYDFSSVNPFPCWLRNGFQGVTWAFDEASVETVSGCPVFVNEPDDPERVTWTPLGLVEGAEPRVVILEARASDHFSEAHTQIWLQEGLPYPVRYEQQHRYEGPGGVRVIHHQMELSSYEQGRDPIQTTPTEPRPLPPLALAPLTETGPAGGRLAAEHPFPLAEALAAATQADEDLADWRAAHGDAYVAYADHLEHTDEEGRSSHRWQIMLADADANRTFEVSRTFGPLVVGGLLGIPETPLPADAPPVTRVEAWKGLRDPLWPAPDRLPAEAPTLASMVAQWEAFREVEGASDPFNTWGFEWTCAENDHFEVIEPCQAQLLAHAGHEVLHFDVDWGTPVNDTRTITSRYNNVELHWKDGEVAETDVVRRSEEPPAAPPMAAPDDQATLATIGTDARWLPLSTGQAAAVGLGALLATLLYWLSPLKAGLFGLFSRVRDDEVLQHPTRARLMDAIAAEPGIHFQELVRRSGGGRGATEQHLRRMERADLILRSADQGFVCYYPKGTDRRLIGVAAATKSPAAARLLDLVQRAPGISTPELRQVMGMSGSTIHHHLVRLEAAGLIEGRKDGRKRTFWATEVAGLLQAA